MSASGPLACGNRSRLRRCGLSLLSQTTEDAEMWRCSGRERGVEYARCRAVLFVEFKSLARNLYGGERRREEASKEASKKAVWRIKSTKEARDLAAERRGRMPVWESIYVRCWALLVE